MSCSCSGRPASQGESVTERRDGLTFESIDYDPDATPLPRFTITVLAEEGADTDGLATRLDDSIEAVTNKPCRVVVITHLVSGPEE